ncbi:MAG: hypothetical protein ACR2QV_00035 [Gammaproteobacteria bacterium]
MNGYAEKIIWVAAVALVTLAANAQRLQRDPFQPPADFGDTTVTNDVSARPQAIEAEVRGILFAGGESLVNFGGQIIGPGEEVNGYRLLEVGEEHAVFQRGDEIVTLSLYPDGGADADADR